MKRIALFSLVLALGLIIVQPLQADTIGYTITGDFEISSVYDPLGIGSGRGTAIINFTLAPPAVSGDTISGESEAQYTPGGLTLTLSGTNANGTYTNTTSPLVGKWNTSPFSSIVNFSSTSNITNDFFETVMTITISGINYRLTADIALPLSFWSDSDVTPLPKLMGPSDNLTPMYSSVGINEFMDEGGFMQPVQTYTWVGLQVTSGVVPLPPTVWLLGPGLLGLLGWRRFRKS